MTDSALPLQALALDSPIGRLVVTGTAKAVTEVSWSDAMVESPAPGHSPVAEAARQLGAYFQGRLRQFDIPMAPRGSVFQARVWGALSAIPYGETASYGDVARMIGSVARPVGMACGANPIPILIPCHRVIAANGRLTGYSGGDGITTKQLLLALENSGQADLFGAKRAYYNAPPNERRHPA